jgi:hypothetical protein
LFLLLFTSNLGEIKRKVMSIRLGNSCVNCQKYEDHFCQLHETTVGTKHTCDSFDMRAAIKDDPNCTTCSRYMSATCPNPKKAAPHMLCNHWAPQEVA